MNEDDPFIVFKKWMSSKKNEINDPNAVALYSQRI